MMELLQLTVGLIVLLSSLFTPSDMGTGMATFEGMEFDEYTGCDDSALDTAGRLCREIDSCQTLSFDDSYYLLTGDVSSAGSCFSMDCEGSVLDLNGHMVEYAGFDFAQVYNGDFEIQGMADDEADGWDISSAPGAERISADYYTKHVYSGDHSIRLPVPQDHMIESTDTVMLSPDVDYMLTGFFYNGVDDSIGAYMEVIDTADNVIARSDREAGITWRGMQFFPTSNSERANALFSVDEQTEAKIRIYVYGDEGFDPGYVYIDYIRLIAYNYVGVNFVSQDNSVRNGLINQSSDDCINCHTFDNVRSDIVIENIESHFGGVESKAIDGYWGCRYSEFRNNNFIHKNYYRNSSKDVVIVRDWLYGIIGCERSKGDVSIHGNRVWGSPQLGIMVSQHTGGDMSEGNRFIYDNDIRHDSKYTQAFAIMMSATNAEAYNNTINLSSGRGIATGGGINSSVHNNHIYVAEQRNQEYTGGLISYGIQVEGGQNLSIFDNHVIATSHENQGDGAALRITGNSPGLNVTNNTFIGIKMHDNQYSSAFNGYGVDGEGMLFQDNIFLGNSRLFQFYNTDNFRFENSYAGRIGSDDYLAIYASNYPSDATSENNTFYNTTVDGVDFHDYYINPNWGVFTNFEVTWPLTVKVYNNGIPVDADLLITNDVDSEAIVSSTGADGEGLVELVQFEVIELEEYEYMYNITATYGVEEQSQIVTLDEDKTITFNFQSENECGNGIITMEEDCDDGNLVDGDGCSAECMYEPYYKCEGQPSECDYLGDVYGWFNNFSLWNFGAETEPLIYQKQGTNLVFVEQGDWVYPSENSASIGFETNLPSKTYVEWGTDTNYGSRTYVEERYFYNHLHHLTGLEQDTTYHYRIVARDERGNIIMTSDRTLDTITYPEKIEISGEGPHVLDQEGMNYVLKGDVYSDTRAITIDADDITLDLNGFVVTYDNGEPIVEGGWNHHLYNHYDSTFGIYSNYGKGSRILNGKILQGANEGQGTNVGIGFNPIAAYNDLEVAGLDIEYVGSNVNGMLMSGSYPIHHNVITNLKGLNVTNRHQGVKSIVGHWTQNLTLYNNLVKRANHQMYQVTGPVTYHNEGYIDSYATNAFGVKPVPESNVSNNKIFLSGYMTMGLAWQNRTLYENNLVYAMGEPVQGRSGEYGDPYCSHWGIRLTQYGGSNLLYEDLLFDGNYIIMKGKEGCRNLRGVGYSSDPYVINNTLQNNYIKLLALDNDTHPVGSYYGGFASYCSHGNPDRMPYMEPVWVINNTFISNIRFVQFADDYGVGGHVNFIGNTFIKEGDHENFHPFQLGFWYWDTYANKFLDSSIVGDFTLEDGLFNTAYESADLDYSVGHSIYVKIFDEAMQPMPYTNVTSRNSLGTIQHTMTDHQGIARMDFHEYTMQAPEGVEDPEKVYPSNDVVHVDGYDPAALPDDVFNTYDDPHLIYLSHCPQAEPPYLEYCDGIDNDCDGDIDEFQGQTTCGLGVCEHTIENCIDGVPQLCDPFEGQLFEDSMTWCEDYIDQDCDGSDAKCVPVSFLLPEDDASGFSNVTFTCNITDLTGISEIMLLTDESGQLDVVESVDLIDGEYIFLEAENFTVMDNFSNGNAEWSLCTLDEECDAPEMTAPNYASYPGHRTGILANDSAMLYNYTFLPGIYNLFARSFHRSVGYARIWSVSANGQKSDLFNNLNSGEFEWEQNSDSFILGGLITVHINDESYDWYWAFPDVLLFTDDLDFDPRVDCGVNASDLHTKWPTKYSLAACNLSNVSETVRFERVVESPITSWTCAYVDGASTYHQLPLRTYFVGTGLFVQDSSVFGSVYPGDPVTFYANYTNYSVHISNASCNISFDTWEEMIEQDDQYTFSRAFNSPGIFDYDIACDHENFAWLNVSSSVVVVARPPSCGDGSCNGGEDCATCSEDCGVCSGGSPVLFKGGSPVLFKGGSPVVFKGGLSALGPTAGQCSDGHDNEGPRSNGCVDGVDWQCGGTESSCADGLDDDCDGLVDCVDDDCVDDIGCVVEEEVVQVEEPLGITEDVVADLVDDETEQIFGDSFESSADVQTFFGFVNWLIIGLLALLFLGLLFVNHIRPVHKKTDVLPHHEMHRIGDYVREMRGNGQSDDVIKKNLKESGWIPEVVDKHMDAKEHGRQ